MSMPFGARMLARGAKTVAAGVGGISSLAVGQAVYLRCTYSAPNEPEGLINGRVENGVGGKPLKVLFVGDSVAIGVGSTSAAPIQAAFANHLSRERRSPVQWTTIGGSGLDTRELKSSVADEAAGKVFDIAVVLCGINDGKKLFEGRWPTVFREDLASLCMEVRNHVPEGPICVPRIPGYTRAPQLQLWPMRHFIRFAFSPYDEQKLIVADAHGLISPTPPLDQLPKLTDRHLWASDGMHPSSEGYHIIGEWLAAMCIDGCN